MNPAILIVEDKAILAHDIIDRLQQFGYQNLYGPFESAEEALIECENDLPDIAILDIQLKGSMSGIDLAKRLNKNIKVPIIYLTQLQDDKTFKDSISTFPVAYLNKPFTNNELRVAIVNAVNELGDERSVTIKDYDGMEVLDDRIFLRNGRGKFYIKLDDILWIKANGETSTIMTKDRLEADLKVLPVIGHNLSSLESKLSFCKYLIRGSRFFMVNLKHVDRIIDQQSESRTTPQKILLIADNEIIIGDKYRKKVMDRFLIL